MARAVRACETSTRRARTRARRAGSVGLFAIQLARFHGAHVITTASARNAEFLSQLGVQQVIDYRATRFEESVHDVDVVFDTVGGETLDRSWSVLKPGGRMITIAADGERASNDRAKEAFFIVEPNGKQLMQIGDLIEAEKLRPFVDAVLPFDEASAAYTGRVVHREGRGKLVIAVAAD